jgi:hypothetical protein
MFTKFLMAAVLAVPLMGVLPAPEAKAESPTAALPDTVQTAQNPNNQHGRTVRTRRTVRPVNSGPRHRHVHAHRAIHHRR